MLLELLEKKKIFHTKMPLDDFLNHYSIRSSSSSLLRMMMLDTRGNPTVEPNGGTFGKMTLVWLN